MRPGALSSNPRLSPSPTYDAARPSTPNRFPTSASTPGGGIGAAGGGGTGGGVLQRSLSRSPQPPFARNHSGSILPGGAPPQLGLAALSGAQTAGVSGVGNAGAGASAAAAGATGATGGSTASTVARLKMLQRVASGTLDASALPAAAADAAAASNGQIQNQQQKQNQNQSENQQKQADEGGDNQQQQEQQQEEENQQPQQDGAQQQGSSLEGMGVDLQVLRQLQEMHGGLPLQQLLQLQWQIQQQGGSNVGNNDRQPQQAEGEEGGEGNQATENNAATQSQLQQQMSQMMRWRSSGGLPYVPPNLQDAAASAAGGGGGGAMGRKSGWLSGAAMFWPWSEASVSVSEVEVASIRAAAYRGTVPGVQGVCMHAVRAACFC